MKYLDRKGLIKTIYTLMLIDGSVSGSESVQFSEIGIDIDVEAFPGYMNDVIRQCREHLEPYIEDQDYYDIVQEFVDSIIENSSEENIVVPSYAIWNLFAIAYNESVIDPDELRIIRHVARKMDMDKSVYLELESYMKTIVELREELNRLESSDKPYSEIRPIVDETELRQKTILEAVKASINDEVYRYNESKDKDETKKQSVVGQKIEEVADKVHDTTGQAINNVKSTFSEKVAPAASGVSDKLKKGIKSTADNISDKSTSLFSKFKKKSDNGEDNK